MVPIIISICYGVVTISACSYSYHVGRRNGIDAGIDGACKFLNSDDGKGFMRHYIFAHELPYLVKTIGTDAAMKKAQCIVNDYESLSIELAGKDVVVEAENILKNLGKEN